MEYIYSIYLIQQNCLLFILLLITIIHKILLILDIGISILLINVLININSIVIV